MRHAWTVLALGLFGSSAAMADGLECQANILYGDNPTVRDVATGTSVTIVPEPYLPTTGIYGTYSFDLGGGGYAPTPIPATVTTYPPVEPAPYVPQPYPAPPAYQPPSTVPSTFLDGTSWVLRSVNGMAVTARATLNFEAGGRYGGRAACNVYGGEVGVFEGFAIDFDGTFATRAACPQLSEERALFDAYRDATDFRVGREGDTLALLSKAGATLATFSRDGGSGGGGTPGTGDVSVLGMWTIAGVLSDGAFSTDGGFNTPTMEFLENGRFSANLGCNTAFGDYTQSGSSLTFGTFAITARACLVPAPFEGPTQAHLPNVRTVSANSDGSISLRDASGTELIRLAR